MGAGAVVAWVVVLVLLLLPRRVLENTAVAVFFC